MSVNKFHLFRSYVVFSITHGFGYTVEQLIHDANIPRMIELIKKNTKIIDLKTNIEPCIFSENLYMVFYIKIKCEDPIAEKKELNDIMYEAINLQLNYCGSSLITVLRTCDVNIIY